MAKTELVITISADGEVGVEVDGVRGPSCLDITRGLEEALGIVTRREKKHAFYASGGAEELVVSARGGEKP